jgi:hypothetical protein
MRGCWLLSGSNEWRCEARPAEGARGALALTSVVAAASLGLISWWLQLALNLGRKRRKCSKTWDYLGDGRHKG